MRKKILFFAQDGIGMGHMRRLARVAEELQGPYSTLFVTGKREVVWMLPQKCEFIHIPSWQGLGLGSRAIKGEEWIDIESESAIRMVRMLCFSIERIYAPDCIIVDHIVGGLFGELHSLLLSSRAKKVMIMRGTMEKDDAKHFLEHPSDILNAFNALLVASDPRTSDFQPENSRLPALVHKTKHVGYVLPHTVQASVVRMRHSLPPDTPWVVCSAGGGRNAERFLQHCMKMSEHFPTVFFDVVLGPYTNVEVSRTKHSSNCRVRKVVPDLAEMHAASDVAVINGGYNSLLESISGGARIIVFPNQDSPEGDQYVHSRRLAEYYPVQLLEGIETLQETLGKTLRNCALSDRPSFTLAHDGAGTIRGVLDDLLQSA